MESLLFYDWIAINWTVFCYVIHWRCYNFSCIWILIPGLPGTSSSLPFGAFGSNSFYDLVVLSHRHNVRFRLLALLWSFLLAHLYQLFLLLMDFRSWCCDCFLSIFTFCTTSSVPGSNFGSNSRFYQTESLLFYDWIAINWTVFVTSSTGGVTTSPVSGF